MNVISFYEVTGRDREDDLDTNVRQRRTFQAITDTAEGGPDQVIAYAGVPLIGDPLQYTDDSSGLPVVIVDTTLVVVRRRAEQTDAADLCNWLVSVDYMSVEEPETLPADVDFSPTRYQEYMVDDINGTPVVNAAGDQLVEGVMRDRTRFTIQILKNIADADWNPITAAAFQDSLNAVPFLATRYPPGYPPGTCKLTLGAKRVRKIGLTQFYWIRTATIDVDLNGWNAKVRNAGFSYYDPVRNLRPPILDEYTGHPRSSPGMLAEDGSVLPVNAAPTICNPPDGFVRYVTLDWTALNLDF